MHRRQQVHPCQAGGRRGLCRAHAGKGLGNKFLDDARQADVLIHVIDASGSQQNNNGRPVRAGTGDPAFDIQFVEEEFIFGLNHHWKRLEQDCKGSREPRSKAEKLACQAPIGSWNKRADDHKCRTSIRLSFKKTCGMDSK